MICCDDKELDSSVLIVTSSVWPVDGEEQMADADHHVVPQWAAVTLAVRLYLVHSEHKELRQI